MSQFIYQQKQAWASLRKKTGFVAAILTTMGTTLGALLCILTLAYVLIVKPLPYPEQDALYKIETEFSNSKGQPMGVAFTYPGLIHLYKNQQLFEQTAMVSYGEDVLTNSLSQPTLNMAYILPAFFDLTGTDIMLGRAFEPSEALDTNNPVAVISHKLWQQEFNSDQDVLGKKVSLSGTSFQIVGVIAKNFVEPQLLRTGRKSDIYLPWDFNQAGEHHRGSWTNISDNQIFIAKLTSPMSASQISQTLTTLMNDTWLEEVVTVDFFKGWNLKVKAPTLKSVILGDSENAVYLLLAGIIGLVLIACANIANLFMSRTAEQQRQLAIHAAVGATKGDLFRTLFSQTSQLMFGSVIIALVIAMAGFYVMQQFLSQQLPRVDELSINGFTLSCALVIALLLALVFARLSSSMINYKTLNSTLQSSGKGTGIQVSKKLRKLLIICQVAIVTTLVFINISLLKDAVNSIEQPLGFKTENITSLSLSNSSSSMPNQETLVQIISELQAKLTELPQVKSISLSRNPFKISGQRAQTNVATNERYVVPLKYVDDSYFEMIEQPLIEGNYFSAADIKDQTDVMIVNDMFAKTLAPSGSALGHKIDFGNGPITVIGIVKGTRQPGRADIPMQSYRPSHDSMALMIELQPGATLTREQAVAVLKDVTSQFTVFDLTTLEATKAQLLFSQYTTAVTSAVLALLTFFLAGVGLYGILSYSIQLRGFEIGTRMAIGAKRKDLIQLIIVDNAAAIAIGVIASIIIMLALYIGYSEQLADYLSLQLLPMFVVTVTLISMISLFACYWPLRVFINRPAIHSLRGSE